MKKKATKKTDEEKNMHVKVKKKRLQNNTLTPYQSAMRKHSFKQGHVEGKTNRKGEGNEKVFCCLLPRCWRVNISLSSLRLFLFDFLFWGLFGCFRKTTSSVHDLIF